MKLQLSHYQSVLFLLVLILLNLNSCNRNEGLPIVENCNELEQLQDYLISNAYQVINVRELVDFKTDAGCPDIGSWVEYQEERESNNGIFFDTLNKAIQLPSFQNYAETDSNPYHNSIRLIKYNFAFGSQDLLVIDCPDMTPQGNQQIEFTVSQVSFAEDCNPPIIEYPDGKPFNINCFKIYSKESIAVSHSQRDSLWSLISQTDLSTLAYYESRNILCHGPGYILDYNSGSSTHYGLRHWELDCPGTLSPLYIVSEALLEMLEVDL
ncbi:MAG: hypothetical protein AAF433_17305 [Bacteroidota bacterium]